MPEHITASPLTWPDGWKRSKRQQASNFKKYSIAIATDFVLEELRRMGVRRNNVIISTDLELRQDGLPYSNQRTPDDVGAAVWWSGKDGIQKVIALDKYNRIACNIYAIGKTIEAMRGIERWGSGEILERTFTGFYALPGPDHVVGRSWRDVLDYYGDDLCEAETAYRKAMMKTHPDRGGSDEAFHEVLQAWEQAQGEL